MPLSKQLKTAVQNTKIVGDPFFTTLEYILSRNEESLRDLLVNQESPRKIGVLPTVLLHPKVDLAFVSDFAKNYNLQNELGYLARTAIILVENIGESRRICRKEFLEFKNKIYALRKTTLEIYGKINGPSIIDDFSFIEFRNRWDVYRYYVYNGATTFQVSKRA